MKRERVSDIKARRDISGVLNLQIRQQERYIRENCSFFAFVGPAHAFPAPRQINRSVPPIEIGGVLIGKPEPSYVTGNHFRSEVVCPA